MTHTLRGRCVCDRVRYTLDLEQAPEEAARTTLCHCRSCWRAFGTNYGLTAKVPLAAFRYETGNPKKYRQENGVTREFCGECGAYLCEYGVGFISVFPIPFLLPRRNITCIKAVDIGC